jgi:hypothetical protein
VLFYLLQEIAMVYISVAFMCGPHNCHQLCVLLLSTAGDAHGDVSIAFTCDPDNRRRLTTMVLEEVSQWGNHNPRKLNLTVM